ncbi:MAG TPA: terminase family protein [Aestuariivirgaceae bacterium]|nr:terminase family protein [Aestuariivirgaceae bacterium]
MRRFLREIADDDADLITGDWTTLARLNQLPTRDGREIADFRVWLVLGGRGAGKTRCGAEWVRCQAQGIQPLADSPARRIALVGPTIGEVRSVMVEGVSGLLSVHGAGERPQFEPSLRRVVWPNGTVAELFSAEQPDSLRGPQFDVAWCDELAKWRHPQETWDMLQFGLRLGEAPRVVVTTTPRPMPLLQRLVADPDTLLARTPTLDNRRFLAPQFLREIEARYGGTRLGRQELDAEIIDDDPDALFRRDLIEAGRARSAPDLVRIVVAIDPPASSRIGANACGIVCAGLGVDGKAYVLDDATLQGASPSAWASRAIALYHSRQADRLIAEVNQGGDMVEAVIREVDPSVSFKAVHASRGKRLRAEPVAALYEQGRVVHVGVFPELEDELVSFDQRSLRPASPDRADALVWALCELMLGRRRVPRLRVV